MNPSHSEPVHLGKDLDLDLWFRGNISTPQSVLIRATDPSGEVRTSFFHLDGRLEQIPVFNSDDPLTISERKPSQVRDFKWSPEDEKKSLSKLIVKLSATSLALVFLAFVVTGLLQVRIILSGSMEPAINPGDLVVAASTKMIEPEVGKVVLYSARDLQGNPVTVWAHRIVSGNTAEGFTIKGDANAQADIGTIPLEDIQSVIVLRIPYIGHLFNIYSLVLIFTGIFLTTFAYRQRKRF